MTRFGLRFEPINYPCKNKQMYLNVRKEKATYKSVFNCRDAMHLKQTFFKKTAVCVFVCVWVCVCVCVCVGVLVEPFMTMCKSFLFKMDMSVKFALISYIIYIILTGI